MRILSIDPGTVRSAYAIYETTESKVNKLEECGILLNDTLLNRILDMDIRYHTLVIEHMQSYGNVIGDTVLRTCVWIGRFIQASKASPFTNQEEIFRKEIVSRICHTARAGDKQVRQAIVDQYGGKDMAIGLKASQGPLYGVKRDMWSALAIAIAWEEKYNEALKGIDE